MTLRPFTTKKVNDSVTLIDVNDTGTSTNDLWSAKKIQDYIGGILGSSTGSISATVGNLSSVGDVVGASAGDYLRYVGGVWRGDSGVGGGGVSATVDNLSSVGDVLATNPSAGDFMQYNGTNWVPVSITGSDVLPAYPMDGYYYGLVYSATGYAWKKYAEQDHFIAFEPYITLNPATLEEGRGVNSFTITVYTNNTADFPLTGYTGLTVNGSAAVMTSVTGVFPTITYSPSANMNSPVSFGLLAENGANQSNESANVAYYSLKYWGPNSATALSQIQVKALTSQAFATAKAGIYTFNTCALGQYLWICWPNTLGTALSFVVAGLVTTFNETTVSVCNTYSSVRTYYCYKSQELQFGTAISVTVT